MGSCTVSRIVLKNWFSRFKGSLVLRLIGLPAAVLTLYLEIYGASPATASLILHRLLRRIRLQTFACVLQRSEHDMSSIFYVGGADSMDRAHVQTQTLGTSKGAASKRSSASTASTIAPSSTTRSHPAPILPMPHSRSKTTSQADIVGQGKRLSLQFPIQKAAGSNSPNHPSPRSRPQSWVSGTTATSQDDVSTPSETNILAVLAAQERYVLELKEELNKAEADLQILKKHYASHEANKFRNDARKVAQLQPVKTSLIDLSPDQEDEDGSNTWMQKEMEQRKALARNSNAKSSQRKVFSGSRHLRTLSLLSPDKAYTPSFPQPGDLQEEEHAPKRPELLTRSSTSSDIARQVVEPGKHERHDSSGLPTIQRDQLIRAGTQMATDLKNGLFTFIEDIRQATVGDEAVHGADGSASANVRDSLIKGGRKASLGRPALDRSASSKKPSQTTGSTGDDFWKEMGLSEPKSSPMHSKKTHTNKPAQTPQKQTRNLMDDDEEWDNWETPNDTYTDKVGDAQDSSDESEPSSPGPGSSRTSTRYHSKRHDSKASSLTTASSTGDDARDSKRNSIPWPDLVKLSPNNLKRTASHLMKEWEKQLTPPPESRVSNHSHGDYIGRSDSPSLI
tara:strand:- start:989 stop:2851 length:1863 start_codon:yes stop_codon:yes gene_type:complete